MKVLSVRQPWAWLICNEASPKNIENRTWTTKYRGPLLVQSSANCKPENYYDACKFAAQRGVRVPPIEGLKFGAIIGAVELVDCVQSHSSRWFEGPVGLVLANPIQFAISIPLKGRLGLFDPPAHVTDTLHKDPQISRWLARARR